jgi:hypothetical protein
VIPFATELEEVRSTDLGKARDIWERREGEGEKL